MFLIWGSAEWYGCNVLTNWYISISHCVIKCFWSRGSFPPPHLWCQALCCWRMSGSVMREGGWQCDCYAIMLSWTLIRYQSDLLCDHVQWLSVYIKSWSTRDLCSARVECGTQYACKVGLQRIVVLCIQISWSSNNYPNIWLIVNNGILSSEMVDQITNSLVYSSFTLFTFPNDCFRELKELPLWACMLPCHLLQHVKMWRLTVHAHSDTHRVRSGYQTRKLVSQYYTFPIISEWSGYLLQCYWGSLV